MRGVNRFLGCELLESRAVMGITGGDAERNLLGRTGAFTVSPVTFMGTTGPERTGWFSHRTQQQGKREYNTIHKKPSLAAQIICLLREKENDNSKSQQTETDIPRTVMIDQTSNEITYGNRGL